MSQAMQDVGFQRQQQEQKQGSSVFEEMIRIEPNARKEQGRKLEIHMFQPEDKSKFNLSAR